MNLITESRNKEKYNRIGGRNRQFNNTMDSKLRKELGHRLEHDKLCRLTTMERSTHQQNGHSSQVHMKYSSG